MLGMHNPNILICTLGTIIISMLDNMLHLKIPHIFIAIVCHTITQKSYRKYYVPQNTRHVPCTRKAYHSRVNKFTNVECFYYMTKGHTSNVCYYRKLHLNMLPLDYFETNKPRPKKFWVQKNV